MMNNRFFLSGVLAPGAALFASCAAPGAAPAAMVDPFEPTGFGAVLLGGWALVCILAVCAVALYLRLRTVRTEAAACRAMVEESNAIVLRIGSDGIIRYANRSALEVFGYPYHELVGSHVERIIPERSRQGEDQAGLWGRLRDCPDELVSNENDNVTSSGETVRIAWTNTYSCDEEGNLVEVVSTGTDVTALRRQVYRLELAWDQAEEGVALTDRQGIVEYANRAWATQHGFDEPEQVLGMTLPFFNPDHADSAAMRELSEQLERRDRAAAEVRCPVRGGGSMACRVSAAVVRGHGGEHLGFVAIFRDLGRQKTLERDARKKQERFDQLVGAIDEAFWLAAPDRLLYVSPGHPQVLECAVELGAAGPRDLFAAVHEGDRERLERELASPAYTREGVLDVQVRVVRQDGGIRWLRVRSQPVRRRDDQLRMAGLAADITEFKEIEDRLRQARDQAAVGERTKSMILSNITHELRTPLNGVLGMLQILEMADLDEALREHVDTAMASARELSGFVDAVLRYSELDSGNVETVHQPFSLFNLLQGVMESHRPPAQEHGLMLTASIAPGTDDLLVGDGQRLREILDIVAGNAIKFTPEGHVSLTVATGRGERPGQVRVSIAVADTGVGIPEHRQREVLEGFVQADQDYSRRYGGLGLGLAMARRMLELMDGTITLESVEGEGTTVYLGLEMESMEETLGEELAEAPRGLGGRAARVLLCEGQEADFLALKFYLQRRGVEVYEAHDLERARKLLADPAEYDLVVLRDRVPGGISRIMEQVCGGSAVVRVPVVLVGDSEEARACLAMGAVRRVVPPVDLARFWKAFVEILEGVSAPDARQ